jgi:hypothetical protein
MSKAMLFRQAWPSGISPISDMLRIRLGPDRVLKLAPVESNMPERSIKRVGPIAPSTSPSGLKACRGRRVCFSLRNLFSGCRMGCRCSSPGASCGTAW